MTRTATTDRFAPGARIGDYVVEREVAYEAAAIVYFATHVVLPRQSQVKVSHPGSRPAAVQLLREACILEALSHPGAPRVHECGVLPDRRPWSSIERLGGVALDQFLGDRPAALSDVVVALRDVADVLRHAHERGIVHRRLTASAVLRTERRRSVYAVVDWADARTLDAAAGVAVDARDDILALGAIGFRALTARDPEPGVSLATHCPAAPTELISLIDQMLTEPVARPTAGEIYDRALWLCETLEVSPLFERPRWTPPRGFVSESASSNESGGFSVRIGRDPTR
jgi:serine/threonine protein kinase